MRRRDAFWLGWLGGLVPLVSAGQSLPPAAQEAMQRGLAAAVEQQDYPLAVKYFREAQQLAPGDTAGLYWLALACDKAGRELPAIAAYRAYLASAPQADNGPVVRQRITALEVAVESKINRVLRMATESAELLPDAAERSSSLRRIAEAWAEVRDWSAATRVATCCSVSSDQDAAFREIARHQAWRGEFAAAAETAARIQAPAVRAAAGLSIQRSACEAKNLAVCRQVCAWIPEVPIRDPVGHSQAFALANLAELQAQAGDLDGARETTGRIPADRRHKACALAWVAEAAGQRGDRDAARKLLIEARQAALACPPSSVPTDDLEWIAVVQARVGDADEAARTMAAITPRAARPSVYFRVAKKQLEAGDKRAALASAAQALNDAEETTKEEFEPASRTSGMPTLALWRCMHYRSAVEVQLGAGDSAAARRVAERALALAREQNVSPGNEHFLPDIAYEQARADDVAGAQATAARIPHAEVRAFADCLIARARAAAHDGAGATAALDRIPAADHPRRSLAAYLIAQDQVRRGDLDGALQTVAPMKVAAPQAEVWRLIAAAQWQAGQESAARKSLAQALQAAGRVTGDSFYPVATSDLLRDLAVLQARLGDAAAARQTADRIPDVGERLSALLLIDRGERNDEQIKELHDWTQRLLEDPRHRWTNLHTLATVDLENKLRQAQQGPPKHMVEAVLQLAQQLSSALESLRNLEQKWQKTRGAH